MIQSDEEVVDRARKILANKRRMRWHMLGMACMFLGLSCYFTIQCVHKIENLDGGQISAGFVHGLSLAVVWSSFGVLGALCLGKFLIGFDSDFHLQELLVRYHDRLRDLNEIPKTTTSKQADAG